MPAATSEAAPRNRLRGFDLSIEPASHSGATGAGVSTSLHLLRRVLRLRDCHLAPEVPVHENRIRNGKKECRNPPRKADRQPVMRRGGVVDGQTQGGIGNGG